MEMVERENTQSTKSLMNRFAVLLCGLCVFSKLEFFKIADKFLISKRTNFI